MPNINNCLCFTANEAGSTISMSITGTPTLSHSFYTSIDESNWIPFTPGTTSISLANVGDKVYFKGINYSGLNESESIFYNFVLTGSLLASGNIMSLIDNGTCTSVEIPNSYCFYMFFRNCSSLITAPELPATTLLDSCYNAMFYNCTSLITTPELPAKTLKSYCYRYMFYKCSSLTRALTLSAINVASFCCYGMFAECTSLTVPPKLLSTILAERCYWYMFFKCTSLTIPPVLSATTLANYCYGNMFSGCTSLIALPVLLATILAENCYNSMFEDCTSLIISDASGSGYAKEWKVPNKNTFENTYAQNGMFRGCQTGSGRSSSGMAGLLGYAYTYYTQNMPNPTLITFESNCYPTTTKNISGLPSYQLTAGDLSPRTNHGYIFDNWYIDSSYLTKALIGQSIDNDITLYGKGNFKYLVDIRGENDIQKNGIIQNARDYKLDTARKMLNDNIYIYAVTHDYDMGWDYHNKVGDKPTNLSITTPYTGQEITNGYSCPEHVTMIGVDRGVNPGTYIAIYTPDIGYVWNDGSTSSVLIILNIILLDLCFTANTAGSTIGMATTGISTLGLNFLYTTDGTTWTPFTPGTTIITLANIGDKVYFKGNNPNGVNESPLIYYNFVMTGSISASGNIMSLIDNGACSCLAIPCSYCFALLFKNCTALTSAEELLLSATSLHTHCYRYMFNLCSGLIYPPTELPSLGTATYCYGYMFYKCTSLLRSPIIKGYASSNSFYAMFSGCTSLTTISKLYGTYIYAESYAYMFEGCTSLVISDNSGGGYYKPFRLPASGTFESNYVLYGMFYGCAGTRLSNNMGGHSGYAYTYYTQNEPI